MVNSQISAEQRLAHEAQSKNTVVERDWPARPTPQEIADGVPGTHCFRADASNAGRGESSQDQVAGYDPSRRPED